MSQESLEKEYICAMRGLTSTVNVLSAERNGVKKAMTATAVTSLSLDPPSMIASVNLNASIHNLLSVGNCFCINVLTSSQSELADVCSKNEEEDSRFKIGNWVYYDNIPYNQDSQSNVFCRCFDLSKQVTHTIFFGEVIKVINNDTSSPLLYREGDYVE